MSTENQYIAVKKDLGNNHPGMKYKTDGMNIEVVSREEHEKMHRRIYI
jgi:hypothetical protein